MKKTEILSKLTLLSLFVLLYSIPSFSQVKRYKVYDEYIVTYSGIAQDNMKKHKIPASITLAQGLLESGGGKSSLTVNSNNHFGIKCHSDWTGEKVYKADDGPNDCFRKYKKAEDSFEDHSKFLLRSRYKKLFDLDITDYRGWARGLQQAGYATDKAYANKLIKLIEDYQLYLYDKGGVSKVKKQEESYSTVVSSSKHVPYKTHNLIYVVANDGDSYDAIAAEFSFKPKDLHNFNEVPEGFPLKKGDLVYFQKKKSKADKPFYDHVVQVGESMHSISQLYGVKVKNLYKMNKKDFEYVPEEGDVLKLR